MRHQLAIVAYLAALMLSVSVGYAQQPAVYPKVSTSVDPTSGTVGERFKLVVSATVPDLDSLEVMPLFDTQTSWTAVGDPAVVETRSGSDETRTLSYIIVPFETGQLDIPRIALTYTSGAPATSSTVLSESLWVDVNSVLSGDGSASALRDVKPPVVLPVPPAVLWTGGILLFIILAIVGYLIWRRYAVRLRKMLGRSLSPPELAIKEIDALDQERLIEQKKIKELYTRLSDTLRHYLETAYQVPATDLTSNELLRAMDDLAEEQPRESADSYRTAMARLVELLDEADLVKFARLRPEAARCRKALQSGREIVELTSYCFAPEEEKVEAAGKSNNNGPRPPAPPTYQASHSPASPAEVSQ